MLSLSDMRKAFFHIMQPVVHDEMFDFALKMAREANLDARAISEEDTLIFFKRIVAKLHGVNLHERIHQLQRRSKKIQLKRSLVGNPPKVRAVENLKERSLRYQKVTKGKERERETIDRRLHLHKQVRVVSRKREIISRNLPLLRERVMRQCQSRTHLRDRRRHPLRLPHLYPKQRRR